MTNKNQIEIFQTKDGLAQIRVQLKEETVWLNRKQLSDLFDRDIKTLGKHINNVFKEGELDKKTTVAKFATVQYEGAREVTRQVEHYNLDVIISVGYRVKSKRGTQFRIWANKILKDYLVKGFVINEKRLQEKATQFDELKRVVQIQGKVITEYQLESDEAKGLIKVIADYTYALDMLDDYDHQRLEIPQEGTKELFKIDYNDAKRAINNLGE